MTRAHVDRVVTRGLLLCLALATCKTSAGPDPTGRLLAVTISGTGTGSVTGTGIDCPNDCSETLEPSSSITLTATPGANSTFGGWSHDCTGNNPNTTFTIGPNPRCDARFDQAAPTATLSVAIDSVPGSPGKVSGTGIDCGNGGTDCTESYPLNTTTTLTVTHPGTSSFAGWGGDCLSFASNVQITLPITANKSCTARFAAVGGGMQARGAYAFGYRVEAGALTGTKVLVAGYDNSAGQIIDVSNIQVLQSPAGAEFSACDGARGAIVYFNSRQQYNADVFHATCTSNRYGSTTLATGGFTELQNLLFAPGKAAHYQANWLAISDFEFGRLRKIDQSDNPQPSKLIELSPGQRSCPFSLTLEANYAYVVGREGEAGTSTAQCNDWVGVWKVDLNLESVVGFAKFGTKLRDVVYGADDRVYVTDFEEDKVHVLNPATMTLVRSISVGDGPVGLKLKPDASQMLVTNWNTNKLQRWDLSNDTMLDEVNSGGVHPVDVYFSGSNAFVLNFGDAMGSIGGSLQAFTVP